MVSENESKVFSILVNTERLQIISMQFESPFKETMGM